MHRLPNLFGRPPFALLIEVIDINNPRLDTLPRSGKPACVVTVEGAFAHWDRMQSAHERRQCVNNNETGSEIRFQHLICRFSMYCCCQEPCLIGRANEAYNGGHRNVPRQPTQSHHFISHIVGKSIFAVLQKQVGAA